MRIVLLDVGGMLLTILGFVAGDGHFVVAGCVLLGAAAIADSVLTKL